MTRFRFVHAADLHLDTPFDGLARLGEGVPQRLRDASLQAWDNLVAETLRAEAHALVLAGDLYDGPERGLRAQLRFRDGLVRLTRAGVRVFLVHGNHDPVEEGWSALGAWPEGVHAFSASEVEAVPLEVGGRRVATVHGISFAARATRDNLARRFPRASDGPFAIGVLHCNVGSQSEHAAYAPCELADLRAAGMDYWALGHIHRHQVLADDRPWAVYPGVLQGRSPKPSETGAKGALLVDVADGRVERTEFRPLDVVRFQTLQLDAAGLADLAALQDRLQAAAADAQADAGGRALILRAELSGRAPVHRALRQGGGSDELLRTLQEGAPGELWWDRIADRTAPPLDKDAIRERGDVSAELLQRADRLLADDQALDAFLARHARADDHRLRGLIADADPERDRETLARAVDEALDRLEPEDEA